jgi:poly-gamma-glutamate synthesis protein (capsule biosynthesis protein)
VPASKQFVFRGPASALRGVVASGVDVVTLANNHGMDYGQTGLLDTLDAAKAAGLPLVGAGLDAAQAYAPYRRTIKGQRIAVIGATQVLDDQVKAAWTAGDGKPGLASAYEVGRLLASVRQARSTSDTVVVFLHWGVERQTCPPPQARTLAKQLADAGADIIVGSHAHVLLGDGRAGGAYVDYGLGNFMFYNGSGLTAQTGVLTLTVRGRATTAAQWTPGVMTAGRPQPVTGAAKDAAMRAREQRRACTGLSPA